MEVIKTLFDIPEQEPLIQQPPQGKTCRTCEHRARGKSDEQAKQWLNLKL